MLATSINVLYSHLSAELRVGQAVSAFLREKWPEMLILGVMIPSVIGVGALLWNMKIDMSVQAVNYQNLERRVENIASVLPDVRVRVATESVLMPFTCAVLVGAPHNEGGTWKMNAQVLDTEKGLAATFAGEVDGPQDHGLAWAVAGRVQSMDPRAVSVDTMSQLSAEIHSPRPVPASINRFASFVCYRDASAIQEELERLGFALVDRYKGPRPQNWLELTAAMEGKPNWLRLPPE